MKDIIKYTENELVESIQKAMTSGPIITQEGYDYYAAQLEQVSLEILNSNNKLDEDNASLEPRLTRVNKDNR